MFFWHLEKIFTALFLRLASNNLNFNWIKSSYHEIFFVKIVINLANSSKFCTVSSVEAAFDVSTKPWHDWLQAFVYQRTGLQLDCEQSSLENIDYIKLIHDTPLKTQCNKTWFSLKFISTHRQQFDKSFIVIKTIFFVFFCIWICCLSCVKKSWNLHILG